MITTRGTLTLLNDHIPILDLSNAEHFKIFLNVLSRKRTIPVYTNGSYEGVINGATEVTRIAIWQPFLDLLL